MRKKGIVFLLLDRRYCRAALRAAGAWYSTGVIRGRLELRSKVDRSVISDQLSDRSIIDTVQRRRTVRIVLGVRPVPADTDRWFDAVPSFRFTHSHDRRHKQISRSATDLLMM